MANYTYTNGNINFTINDDLGWSAIPNKYGHTSNSWSRINSGKQKDITPFVNAVEIDWNAAQLGEDTISNNCESHCSMIVPAIAA